MGRFALMPFTVNNLADPKVSNTKLTELFTDVNGNVYFKKPNGTIITLINVVPNPVFDFSQVTNTPSTFLGYNISLNELDRIIEKENSQILLKEDFYKNSLSYTFLRGVSNTTSLAFDRSNLNNRNLQNVNKFISFNGTNNGIAFGSNESLKTLFSSNDSTIKIGMELFVYDSLSTSQIELDYSNNRLIFGMTNSPVRGDINTLKGSFFEIDTNTNKFMACSISNSLNQTTVVTDTSFNSNTLYWLVVELSGTNVKFYINNVLKATISTNLNLDYLNPNLFNYFIPNTSHLCISKFSLKQIFNNTTSNEF
jgi:hypothetical protein